VVFASGLYAFRNQRGKLAGHRRLASICKLLYQKEQELGWSEIALQFQPHGLCVIPVVLGQEDFEC